MLLRPLGVFSFCPMFVKSLFEPSRGLKSPFIVPDREAAFSSPGTTFLSATESISPAAILLGNPLSSVFFSNSLLFSTIGSSANLACDSMNVILRARNSN
eukprot:NODE_167_length_16327_cov_0.361597.p10 type:complete len:100 gc:universal NODE_167_length_16327_cov_0.361597:12423-12722(+)